ncbi:MULTISPECIES: HAD family hydrolase [unclassified Vibrio]|uniref:HAD family hydrolase n=1 Tax=unclassified Vibrio TaxID=2614977 RepID=UPI0013616679|nr:MULTISPECIES: HAD family hydrolase [unclassified Vibrio]NAW56178.1 HAD hydrolase-like protein [Vibrio sp. V36_P2S2PM302]NAX25757.1 HAD hydrolase-like protein [Vibrio sp. V38_P2S17PM301]NAX32247.1 HAD hydrolase-like protein [Vibrio sp. V37_P2S8PM304]
MQTIILFDWGNTLMVDFPQYRGKMCDWPEIEVMPHAAETLSSLSEHCALYIATSAKDSAVCDIELAFERVGLARYLSGYFCFANLGLEKDSAQFYRKVSQQLREEPEAIMMVGDNWDKDILPARQAGLRAIWLTECLSDEVETIVSLKQLPEVLKG